VPSGTSRYYALEGQVHTTRSTRGFDSVSFFNSYNNYIESIQIDLAENASAFDRPFEAQQFYSCNSSVIAIARIYVNIIRRLCISQ